MYGGWNLSTDFNYLYVQLLFSLIIMEVLQVKKSIIE